MLLISRSIKFSVDYPNRPLKNNFPKIMPTSWLIGLLVLLALLSISTAWYYLSKSSTSASTPVSALPTKITVVDDRFYPPFAFAGAENEPRGITIDLWKLWSQKTGIAVEFQLMAWDDALTAVRKGQADVVAGLFRTPERDQVFDFINLYSTIPTSLFFHEQIEGVQNLDDLSGFLIGVVKCDSAEEALSKHHPNIKLQPYLNAEELVKAAIAGDIKVFVADTQVVRFYLAKFRPTVEFKEAINPVSVNALYAGTRKGNPQLLTLIQQGFEHISEQEKVAIVEKWVGVPTFSNIPLIAIRSALIGAAVLLCLLGLWNTQLKRKVTQATLDLQQRNQALQSSERNYREIFNATSEMIFLHDAVDGRILDLNQTAVEATGYSKPELLGKSISSLSAELPNLRGEQLSSRVRNAAHADVVVFESRFQRRSGDIFWAEVSLKNSHIGGQNRVLAVVRDISLNKQAQEALKHSEATLRSLFSAVPVGLLITENRILRAVNERCCQILGYSINELIGHNSRRFYESDEEYQRVGRIFYSQPTPSAHYVETRLRRADGSLCEVSMYGAPLHPHAPNSGLAIAIQDITEQKRAAAALQASEERLRNIANNIPGALYQFYVRPSGEMGLHYVSEPAKALFGLDKALGNGFTQFTAHIDPEYRAAFLASIQNSIATESPWAFEGRFIKPNGDVIWFQSQSSPSQRGDELIYSGVILDITQRKYAEQRIEHLAYHDALTNLPNRSLLIQHAELALALAARHRSQFAILFLDLDRFRNINDSLGHDEGDAVLLKVATRLRSLIRTEDTVCRLGGDEFALLLPDVNQDGALRVADKLLEAFQQPFDVAGHSLATTLSIGIALYPHDGANVAELLKNADTALHRAKGEGRNSRMFYNRQMNAATFRRLLLEGELRQAIATNQLHAYYQPKLQLINGALVGVEALIRWQHPERGLISPDEFIPIAESSNLIVALGEWMLQTVCQQLQNWRQDGLTLVPVAVNLAARHFQSLGFADRLQGLLESHGLPSQVLGLELTESTLLETGDKPEETLRAIERLGIKLAIDDFGTGYSNLAYLKRLPLAELKIDRSFVRSLENDANDRILAATVIALGHQMGLMVVAEGVENEQQLRILIDQGCDLAQGFYFARPMPAATFATHWLHSAPLAERSVVI